MALAEKFLEVPQELIRTALDLELADGTVIADTVGDNRCVFLAGLYRAPCFPSPSWDQPGQLHWNLPLRLRLGLPPDFGDPVINFRHIGARVQI